jgi:phosphate-selective porin OprO/OprP
MRRSLRLAVLAVAATLSVPAGAWAQADRGGVPSPGDDDQQTDKQTDKQGDKQADQPVQPPRRRSWLRWRNRPSFQFGEVRLDLRLKLAGDHRSFDPQIDEDEFDFAVRRGGINLEIDNDIEVQVERDLRRFGRWRDVYIDWRTFRQVSIKAGRFKVPFGLEQNTSITDADFAFRSLAGTTIPPARDRGVMVYGRFLRRGITYEAGVFKDDGDNGRLQEPQFIRTSQIPRLGPSFAGRVTGTPLRPLAETFEDLRVGFAYGTLNVPEGLNSLRGETVYGTDEFFEPVYVKGRRTRFGTEFSYMPGPLSLKAEWMRVYEQRKEQGLGDDDLSDVITTGWYVSGTWLITGEDKRDFNNPRDSLFAGGFGAVELGARYETLRFESAEKIGPAFRNPRAEHILPNADHVWTVGVNYFPNRWVRLALNGIRETFDDDFRTPDPGVTEFWSAIARLQIVF